MSTGQQLRVLSDRVNEINYVFQQKVLDVAANILYSKVKTFIDSGALIPIAQEGLTRHVLYKHQLFKDDASYTEVDNAIKAFVKKYPEVAGVMCSDQYYEGQGIELYW